MRGFFRPKTLLGRILAPVLTLVILAAGSAYFLIERIVVNEIHLKAEEGLRAEGERILGRLRADYALLFHAFGDQPERFAQMTQIAQNESFAYLERFNNNPAAGSKIYLMVGGELLLPKTIAPADEKKINHFFHGAPCASGDCLSYALNFAPWGWRMVLHSESGFLLADARRTIVILLAVFSVMTLLIGSAIALAVRLEVHRPMAQISAFLNRLGHGEYHPISLQGSQETEALAGHLNQMGKEIAQREDALKKSESRYRNLSAHLDEQVQNEIKKRSEEQKVLIQNSRVAAMGEMIGAVAHHWRQPLNTLALSVQDIQDAWEHGELDEAYLTQNIHRSMQQITELSGVIDNFRSFFRPDTQPKPFDLRESIDESIALLSPEMIHHNITVRFTPPDFETVLTGYPTQIKQVLINLLINAKDAILLKKEAAGLIDITLKTRKNALLIEMCDNGGGIPDNIMEHIFDPFFSTKEAGKGVGIISGSGVGLYMSKLIVEEQFKGHIYAENRQGGACFVLSLAQTQ